MSLILNIDTATSKASVSLALDGKILQERINEQSMDHAAWIHVTIKELMQVNNKMYQLTDLKAIAVVAGPGSYTGLRVGMSAAKGLCYALSIPLLTMNTLKLLAYATNADNPSSVLLCPMLDARRMEVFTALYDASLNELIAPCALILEEDTFTEWLNKHEIIFSGSGSDKWKTMVKNHNAIFKNIFYSPGDIAFISNRQFVLQDFSDLTYAEPFYLKDFYTTQKK